MDWWVCKKVGQIRLIRDTSPCFIAFFLMNDLVYYPLCSTIGFDPLTLTHVRRRGPGQSGYRLGSNNLSRSRSYDSGNPLSSPFEH